MSKKDFIELVKRECRENGVRYYFPKYQKVSCYGSAKVGGYFSAGKEPLLACATGKKGWVEILIHESCHMDQWKENTRVWRSTKSDIFDDWMNGKNFPRKRVVECIRHSQALELDCEKRAVKKIKKLGLNIDTKWYIKRANAYVLFYSVILETRKWCKKAPYNVPEIVAMMPDRFMSDYTRISPKLMELYVTKCY